MTKVALRGMRFYAFHGYYEFERRIGNTYIVDVEAYLDISNSPQEQIDRTLNYEKIYTITAQRMESKYQLLETLAYDIATEVKAYDDKVTKLSVTIRKMNPPVGGKVDQAEVTITI